MFWCCKLLLNIKYIQKSLTDIPYSGPLIKLTLMVQTSERDNPFKYPQPKQLNLKSISTRQIRRIYIPRRRVI